MTRGNRSALAEGLNFLAYGTYADRRLVRVRPVSQQAPRPADCTAVRAARSAAPGAVRAWPAVRQHPRTAGPAPGRSEPGQCWNTPARGCASATPRRLGLSGPSLRRRLRRVQARHQLVAVFRAVIAQLDALEDEVVTLTEPEAVVVAPTEPEVIVVDD